MRELEYIFQEGNNDGKFVKANAITTNAYHFQKTYLYIYVSSQKKRQSSAIIDWKIINKWLQCVCLHEGNQSRGEGNTLCEIDYMFNNKFWKYELQGRDFVHTQKTFYISKD